MKNILILRAEHHSSGIWAKDGEVDWEDLKLSISLVKKLQEWTAVHASFTDWSDPVNSPPIPLQKQKHLNELGQVIADDLYREIGKQYSIKYVPEPVFYL